MAEGELGAVFRALAKDAAEAAEKAADSVARVAAQTADIQERNVAEILEADARSADRITAAGAKGASETGLTEPSGEPDPGRQARGRRTDAHPTKRTHLPLRRENESADTLARAGYDVEQNPPTRANGRNPDYRIEGEYFDNYAPSTNDLDNIRDEMSKKVKKGQAARLVLNLDDCPRSPDDIRAVLERKPVGGLDEVLVVKDGRVVPFYPFA